jgi:hypothetical protein
MGRPVTAQPDSSYHIDMSHQEMERLLEELEEVREGSASADGLGTACSV